jgi:hypothetical protein
VDDLFTAILQADAGGPPPVAVKYLFDFFDAAARRHGITDPEVVHTWKSNRSAACDRLFNNARKRCLNIKELFPV